MSVRTRRMRWPARLVTPRYVTDEYGDEVEDGTETVDIWCHAFPTTSSERTAAGQVSTRTWNLYLPLRDRRGYAIEVPATARIILADGPTLELDGPTRPVRSPRTGRVDYQTATGREVE